MSPATASAGRTLPSETPAGSRTDTMKRILAAIQVIFILIIVGFGTWQLYLGNFEAAFASFPFLVVYYVFIVAVRRRQ